MVYVWHDSREPGSPLRPELPGNALQRFLTGTPDLLVTTSVNSAFHGSPDLAAWLTGQDVTGVVVTGISTNHCCETTARVGANLGFDVVFPLDATDTFGPDPTGRSSTPTRSPISPPPT